MNSTMQDAPKATSREWFGLGVLALPCLLYSMDLTVLNLAVPKLTATLRPTSTELLWIVDIYGFVLAGALIPMGVLGDRIGRRRLLLTGAAAFGCASVLAAFASLGGARSAAEALPDQLGAALVNVSRNAFIQAFQTTALASGCDCLSHSGGDARHTGTTSADLRSPTHIEPVDVEMEKAKSLERQRRSRPRHQVHR